MKIHTLNSFGFRWLTLTLVLSPLSDTFAATVSGVSASHLGIAQRSYMGDENSDIPLYQQLSLFIDDIKMPFKGDARFVFSGWGRLQMGSLGTEELQNLGATRYSETNSADLGLLYLESKHGAVAWRLGRQLITQARMAMIDGMSIRLKLYKSFYAEAFSGVNVLREFKEEVTRDYHHGIRLALPWSGLTWGIGEGSVGYRQQINNDRLAHQEVAADVWGYLGGGIRLIANGVVEPRQGELIEARIAISISNGVNDVDGDKSSQHNWQVTLDAKHAKPALLLSQTSIFSVFALADHEALGGDIEWNPSRYYRLSARGHALWFNGIEWGFRGDIKATTFREAGRRSQVGVELRKIYEPINGYIRGRFFSLLYISKALQLGHDLHTYYYDLPVNGVKTATTLQASMIYNPVNDMRIAATLSGGSNPYAKNEVAGMLRFIYGYQMDLSREVVQ